MQILKKQWLAVLFVFIVSNLMADINIGDTSSLQTYLTNSNNYTTTGNQLSLTAGVNYTASASNHLITVGQANKIFSGSALYALKFINSTNGALSIRSGYSMTFQNFNAGLSFSNNKVADIGGGIYNNGSLTIKNSTVTFSGNIAQTTSTSYGGGAIYSADTGKIVFENSYIVFDSNRASTGWGGAIQFTIAQPIDIVLNVKNSTVVFSNNTAKTGGGAIDFPDNSSAIFKDSSITFSGNTSGSTAEIGEAGAIKVDSTFTLEFNGGSVLFSGNRCSRDGATLNNSGTVNFINNVATFKNNYDVNSYQIYSAGKINFTGGAVDFQGNTSNFKFINSWTGVTWNISELRFTDNKVSGGIQTTMGDFWTVLERSYSKSIRASGNANTNGNGGFMSIENRVLELSGVLNISQNTAGRYGGGIILGASGVSELTIS
ncbi:MAG: hypothetical protein LBU55_04515, partial [Elusimicrobiota bacterium]|nr:hypothetical protein [Elusimicrobiota bacterium]